MILTFAKIKITMSNIYLGYHFSIEPKELGSEILIAELGEKAFESFIETETGFSAFAPDLPGVMATGKTRKIVKKNMYEGILFHLEAMKEEKLKVPVGYTESEMMVFAG